MHLLASLIVSLILSQCSSSTDKNDFNPYEVLGLSRTASEKDIRQAYKKLAKHWHPDKNSEPNAHEQFTKINAAYEILSDSTKRQNYDEYGTTSQDNQRGFNTNHFRDPFDIFRAHFGGDFHFFSESPTGAKKFIHSREFLSNILPNSDKKPYVLFGSSNFCFHCRQALKTFRALEQQYNDVGIGTAEFNVNDRRLSNELGVLNAPSLCVVSQRRVYHFNDHGQSDSYSETNIKEFVRQSIPIRRYIRALHSLEEFFDFISSYNRTNRVQAILVTRQKVPTLKFVLPCLQYSTRLQCASLNSSVIITDRVPSFFRQLSSTSDTVFLFKEDKNPVAVIRDSELTFLNIQKLFESEQLLLLPTITSSNVFNLVCQTNSIKPCFLIIGDSNLFEQYRSSFLPLVKQLFQQYGSRMAFLDTSPEKQIAFRSIISSIYQGNEEKLFILVARRWMDTNIELVNTDVEFDQTSLQEFQRNRDRITADIEANLKLFLNTRWQKSKKVTLPILLNFDDRNQNIFIKLFDQFEDKWNYWFQRNPLLRSLSGYLFTYQFWIFLIPVVIYLFYSKYDSTNHSQQRRTSNEYSTPHRTQPNQHRRWVNDVNIEQFDRAFLERYQSPGAQNAIILLLIADSVNDPCIGHFTRQISSINDSRMIFAVLYRDRFPGWLDELYENIEADQRNPIPRCHSSTVLALYIRRKFFVPYWSLTNHEDSTDDSAAFLGMNSRSHQHRSSSTSSNDSIASTTDSLSFLDWIDLLFDGTIRTPISISHWPMIPH